MESILGSWKLKENKNFSNFLIFTQTPWYQRMIAEYSPIDVTIKKKDNGYIKKIESTFYNTEEFIILDDKTRDYDNIRKKYKLEENRIDCCVNGSIVNWNERIYKEGQNLVIEYCWLENGELKTASQDFVR